MEQKFVEGFIKQCEVLGVDPEAVVKLAGKVREQLETVDKYAAVTAELARPLVTHFAEKRALPMPNWFQPGQMAQAGVQSLGKGLGRTTRGLITGGRALQQGFSQGFTPPQPAAPAATPASTFRGAQNAFTGRPAPMPTPAPAPVAAAPAASAATPAAGAVTPAPTAGASRFAGLKNIVGQTAGRVAASPVGQMAGRVAASPFGKVVGGTTKAMGSAAGTAATLLAGPLAGAVGGFSGAGKGHGLQEAAQGFREGDNIIRPMMQGLGRMTSNLNAPRGATAGMSSTEVDEQTSAGSRAKALRGRNPVTPAPTPATKPATPATPVAKPSPAAPTKPSGTVSRFTPEEAAGAAQNTAISKAPMAAPTPAAKPVAPAPVKPTPPVDNRPTGVNGMTRSQLDAHTGKSAPLQKGQVQFGNGQRYAVGDVVNQIDKQQPKPSQGVGPLQQTAGTVGRSVSYRQLS